MLQSKNGRLTPGKLAMASCLSVACLATVSSSAQAASLVGEIGFVGTLPVTYDQQNIDFGSNGLGVPGPGVNVIGTGDFADLAGVTASFSDLTSPVPIPLIFNANGTNTSGLVTALVPNFITFSVPTTSFTLQSFERVIKRGGIDFNVNGFFSKVGFDDTAVDFAISIITGQNGPGCETSDCTSGADQTLVQNFYDDLAITPQRTTFSGTLATASVPEPSTILGSLLASSAVLGLARRKRKKSIA